MDNIFTILIGSVPTPEDILVLQPPIPSNWTYFAVENLPYQRCRAYVADFSVVEEYKTKCHAFVAGLAIFGVSLSRISKELFLRTCMARSWLPRTHHVRVVSYLRVDQWYP